jgi:hypothetical protein
MSPLKEDQIKLLERLKRELEAAEGQQTEGEDGPPVEADGGEQKSGSEAA